MKPTALTPMSHGALQHCFGCGQANLSGLRLKFFADEQQQAVSRVRLARRFEGPPGHAHGGVIATLLDEAMSKANRLHDVVAMTRQIDVEYIRPVRLQQTITVIGRRVSHQGRKHFCEAELRDVAGDLLARGKALFIAIDRSILQRSAKIGAQQQPKA